MILITATLTPPVPKSPKAGACARPSSPGVIAPAHYDGGAKMREALVPPKPKELDSA